MTTSLAPRPANEERRAKAVIQTGLIDNPKPELFQVYCDLAKDITDFDSATFSLFDNDFQCGWQMQDVMIMKLAKKVRGIATIYVPMSC